MIRFAAVLVAGVLIVGATSAFAGSGDMFDTNGATIQNRPPVEDDRYYDYTHRQDMFPQSTGAAARGDMFGSVPPPQTPPQGGDMFPGAPQQNSSYPISSSPNPVPGPP